MYQSFRCKQALMEDPVSILLGDLILNGWPNSCKDLEDELKPYWIHIFNLSLLNGVILLGEDQIVVPPSLREKFLTALHYTHQGITKTLARARNNAYWPGLAHDMLKLCQECEICVEDHADPSISSSSHSKAYGPGFKYGVDIGEIDGYPHLVVWIISLLQYSNDPCHPLLPIQLLLHLKLCFLTVACPSY